jgi:hypothetical protein
MARVEPSSDELRRLATQPGEVALRLHAFYGGKLQTLPGTRAGRPVICRGRRTSEQASNRLNTGDVAVGRWHLCCSRLGRSGWPETRPSQAGGERAD